MYYIFQSRTAGKVYGGTYNLLLFLERYGMDTDELSQ